MTPRTTESAIGLPPEQAIAFLRQKTNTPTARWGEVWDEAHSRAFTVAGATSQALLSDFRAAVAKALEQGTTLADFRKDFDSIVEKHGWEHNGSAAWRSKIIYETNLSMAYAAGRYAEMTEPDTLRVYPYWQYQHTSSAHPRPQHLAWVGTTLRADDAWWSTHYPPNGWRCRCSVRPVSEAGLRRQGKTGPDTAPPIETKPYTIRATGRVVQVPDGIDPGFGYNPGAAWGGQPPPSSGAPTPPVIPPTPAAPVAPVARAAPAKPAPSPSPGPAERIPAPPADATPRPAADLDDFLRRPRGRVIVGDMAPDLARAIEPVEAARPAARAVQMSEETFEKQQLHHPDLDAAAYKAVQPLLAAPEMVLRQDARRLVLLGPERDDGARLAAFVKAAGTEERFLVSLRWARAKDIARLLRRYGLMMRERGAPEGPPENPS